MIRTLKFTQNINKQIGQESWLEITIHQYFNPTGHVALSQEIPKHETA